MTIKDMVGGDKKVRFVYYKASELWYECENGFRFPVPVEETGVAEFLAEDKAIYLMRWIRKHLTMIDTERSKSEVAP